MVKKLMAGAVALAMACATPALAAPMHGGGFHGGGAGFHGGARGFGGGYGRGYGGGYGRGGYGRGGYGRGGYGYAPYVGLGLLGLGAAAGGAYLYENGDFGGYGYPSSLQGGAYEDQCARSDRYRARNGQWYYCQ